MTELLHCPFCGGEAIVTDCVYHLNLDDGSVYDKKGWTVGCRTVGCRGWFNRHINTEAEAIAAWNTRAATTIGKVQVEVAPTVRTCNPVEKDGVMRCSECDYPLGIMSVPAFCAGCGAKVVEK